VNDLGDVLWSMLAFFFLFMAIWIFIAVFADIFRRNDISGWGKAGWVILIFIVPFLGALIYLIARPKMTAQDKEDMQKMQEAQRRMQGYSAADEIDKLAKLRDEGQISAEEYESMKKQAMLEV
jgi:hypothetical protein